MNTENSDQNSQVLQEFVQDSLQQTESNLFQILLNQIEKDLNMCGLDWSQLKPTNPEQLLIELYVIINNLLKAHYKNDIRMLLYRVDVSEKLLRQIDNLTVEEIVNLVLRREIEKVWMKHKYSNL